MKGGMNSPIHIQVKIIELNIIGVGLVGIEWYGNVIDLHEIFLCNVQYY